MNSSSVLSDYGLDALAALLHETAKEKGFWEPPYSYDKIGNKLALVHSEVTEVLEAIRNDFARPTVHARNLFHTSIAMYDIWAVFDENADTFFFR